MLRRALMALCLCTFAILLGCDSSSESNRNNPDKLDYGKSGPPSRDGVKGKK
jgi:hypothetical protein